MALAAPARMDAASAYSRTVDRLTAAVGSLVPCLDGIEVNTAYNFDCQFTETALRSEI